MSIQKSSEDYLETILILKKNKGVVYSVDVARYLGYSKPSISRAVSNLRRDGLLEMLAGGELELTTQGKQIAENIYERHQVLTNLFLALGVSQPAATDDACRVEHVISQETFERIREMTLRFTKAHPDGLGSMAQPNDAEPKEK